MLVPCSAWSKCDDLTLNIQNRLVISGRRGRVARDYGLNFLKDFVESRECDPKLKKAYERYLTRFELIEILWGGSGAY